MRCVLLIQPALKTMLYEFWTKVCGYEAYLCVNNAGGVCVRINGLYHYRPIPPRIGAVIIRRCRKALLEWFKTAPITELHCSAYSGDGKEDYRKRVFQSCGFSTEDGYTYSLKKPPFYYIDLNGRRI